MGPNMLTFITFIVNNVNLADFWIFLSYFKIINTIYSCLNFSILDLKFAKKKRLGYIEQAKLLLLYFLLTQSKSASVNFKYFDFSATF